MHTIVHFNITTPSGRAIEHVLTKSALARVHEGIEVKHVNPHDATDGGRTLIVHPQFGAWCSQAEAQLLIVVESLAGMGGVNLRWVLDDLDDGSKRAVAEAVFIAGGFTGHTLVQVSA